VIDAGPCLALPYVHPWCFCPQAPRPDRVQRGAAHAGLLAGICPAAASPARRQHWHAAFGSNAAAVSSRLATRCAWALSPEHLPRQPLEQGSEGWAVAECATLRVDRPEENEQDVGAKLQKEGLDACVQSPWREGR
jgi:hypothetical protein